MSSKPEQQTLEAIELPGALLKAAREARGLSVEQMAERSHLTKNVIRGIESDEYEGLASLGFVRGYLKLYAKKLEVDEASVLGPFDRWHALQVPEEEKPADYGLREHAEGLGPKRGRWVFIMLLLVFGALLAFGVFWAVRALDRESMSEWLTMPEETTATESAGAGPELLPSNPSGQSVPLTLPEPAAPSEAVVPDPSDDLTSKASTADMPSQGDGDSEPSTTPMAIQAESRIEATESEMAESPIVEATPSVTPPSAPVQEPVVGTSSAPSPVGDPVVVDGETQLMPASTARVVSETVTGLAETQSTQDRLVLQVTGDSWVEVREASGRLVLADLLRAGRNVSVNVTGPFELLVGAVDVTTVIFNGETLDLSDRAFQNVARVNLGESRN